jgi:hypothetical protein
MAIGSANAPPGGGRSDVQVAADLLRDRLADPPPLADAVVDSPPEGKSLGDVLLDSNTELGVLEAIKNYTKALSKRWEEGPEHAVAVSIYYAAIAAALLHHGRKITAISYAKLVCSIDMLIEAKWMDLRLAKLLADARDLCRRT